MLSDNICVQNQNTTLNNGYLGSRNDEERSEMRYLVWIAGLSESSKFWTHIALMGDHEHACLRNVTNQPIDTLSFFRDRKGDGDWLS